jgi:hypothetical protein
MFFPVNWCDDDQVNISSEVFYSVKHFHACRGPDSKTSAFCMRWGKVRSPSPLAIHFRHFVRALPSLVTGCHHHSVGGDGGWGLHFHLGVVLSVLRCKNASYTPNKFCFCCLFWVPPIVHTPFASIACWKACTYMNCYHLSNYEYHCEPLWAAFHTSMNFKILQEVWKCYCNFGESVEESHQTMMFNISQLSENDRCDPPDSYSL